MGGGLVANCGGGGSRDVKGETGMVGGNRQEVGIDWGGRRYRGNATVGR